MSLYPFSKYFNPGIRAKIWNSQPEQKQSYNTSSLLCNSNNPPYIGDSALSFEKSFIV